MVMQVIAWILLAIGVIAMLARRPVRNCQGCVWARDGCCDHPTASQVPELPEIQMGMWRCPWRELANDKRDLMITWGGNESRQSADPTVRELMSDD
jgi:hypothetical protein